MKAITVEEAQRDVRQVFRGGLVGQAVSGLIWLASVLLAAANTPRTAVLALILGGIFIFPLTQIVLKLLGGPGGLPKGHPMNGLAMQVAFIVPLCIPIILGATASDANWFYPAFLIVVGAHYLPFIFLYGMKEFAVLAGAMLAAGVVARYAFPGSFSLGGWLGAGILLLFTAFAAARKPYRN